MTNRKTWFRFFPIWLTPLCNITWSTISLIAISASQRKRLNLMDYLYHPNQHTLFITSTSTDEIINKATSLYSKKSAGLNSLPAKILKLLENDISIQLAKLLNKSLSTGVFPSQLKTAEVIHIHKRVKTIMLKLQANFAVI